MPERTGDQGFLIFNLNFTSKLDLPASLKNPSR